MKTSLRAIASSLVLLAPLLAAAVEVDSAAVGDAGIVIDYEVSDSDVAVLTVNALIDETNDARRGLRNSDPRRLARLGQLIYQCRLMLHLDGGGRPDGDEPVLISRNYSLFTGVDIDLAADEKLGVRVQALGPVDDRRVFTQSLGGRDNQRWVWETVGDGSALNLWQFDVNVLKESDLVQSADHLDVIVRFPVFQMARPASQWSYSFAMADFRRAVRRVDEECRTARLLEFAGKND